MNRDRRRQLADIAGQLMDLRERIEVLREEEQEAYDNLPESLQEGERGQAIEQAVDALDTALAAVDEVTDALEEAQA